MLSWLAHCVSPFCLGHPGRLSLRACHSSFLWFQLAEDRIVLGDVFWQLGLSLFILGRFFLLGMGLGPCMKWAGAAEFFDPTLSIMKILYIFFYKIYMRNNWFEIWYSCSNLVVFATIEPNNKRKKKLEEIEKIN